MSHMNKRMKREHRTIEAMISLYCHGHHGNASLCPECKRLLDYAFKRLKKCPFQEKKPVCGHCTVHCYKPEMKETIRAVMRYSGPRMLYQHPVLAFHHLMDSRKTAPASRS